MFRILSIEFVSGYLDTEILFMWLYMLQTLSYFGTKLISVKMEMHTDNFNVIFKNILKGLNSDETHIMNNIDS